MLLGSGVIVNFSCILSLYHGRLNNEADEQQCASIPWDVSETIFNSIATQ